MKFITVKCFVKSCIARSLPFKFKSSSYMAEKEGDNFYRRGSDIARIRVGLRAERVG